MNAIFFLCVVVCVTCCHVVQGVLGPHGNTSLVSEPETVEKFLARYDREAAEVFYNDSVLQWNYNTNITDYNQQLTVNNSLVVSRFQQDYARQVAAIDQSRLDNATRRTLSKIADIGTDALEDESKIHRLNEILAEMVNIYSTAKVCLDGIHCVPLDPNITELMATSRDYDELSQAWTLWRNATGRRMKDLYAEFVALGNEGVRKLGYQDMGEHWRARYEDANFQQELQDLLRQLQPLYQQLHAYVRKRLMAVYGQDRFPSSGHIPAHLLGNMWAQEWNNIYDLLLPYPNKTSLDVTDEMRRQNWTMMRMFRTSEEFYTSLGLSPMPDRFWNFSMLQRPADGREVVCHASAWDFYNGQDFRIKMCTVVNMEDLITIHHEMGHVQYYLQYKNLPVLDQEGANPGFHEAIGDTMALSVATPAHLNKIGLLKTVQADHEAEINFLLKMALEKIAFLPFGYLIDQWRWSVFSGETPPQRYNEKWWELRCKLQGVAPPVARTEEDFDPGAKFHVPDNTPYIRYFVSFVLQFTFYQRLCEAANHTGPLHECDFYRSSQAGQVFKEMLQKGSSEPWQDILYAFNGQRVMDASAILEYFKPLTTWLEQQNAGENVGWNDTCITGMTNKWLQDFDLALGKVREEATLAEWAYGSNITNQTEKLSVEAQVRLATFQREQAHKAEELQWRNLSDVTVRRQFQLLTNIGPSAMKDAERFKQMQTLQATMEGYYGSGKVCLNNDNTISSSGNGHCLGLEPDLEDILAESQDYDRLLAVWKGWRDVTGPKMKPLYQQFVALSNEGVREQGNGDTGEFWRSFYESDTFQADLQALLEQLSPLYQQLHAYVRARLQAIFGKHRFPETGHIPAHLLGNMWAQEWNNIYHLVKPYPNRTAVDVTETMRQQNYTVQGMFKTAEDFFVSLGFEPMPAEFWSGSITEKPQDRDMVCHASAWDFFNGRDFRIKMCSSVTMEDLTTIHHEMGHIQYFLQYRHQPQLFRDGANPGFHEAVGDTIALSFSTPSHLRKIGLLAAGQDSQLDEINFLLAMALERVAFLPFGYLIDQWRWSVFSGETSPQRYNDMWWELRCKLQGISPPVLRRSDDFDPGAKYHVPGNTPYIRYFVARVLQFQLYKALCQAAGHTGPLHTCDFYRSQEAGQKFRAMLRKGASAPWPEVLEELTGRRRLDAEPLLEYFRPLQGWLQEQNARQVVGWARQCPDAEQISRTTMTTTDKTPPRVGGSVNEGRALRVTGAYLVTVLAASWWSLMLLRTAFI